MNYQTKDFSHLIGLPGFSNTLLENHFKLYQGYVANTNKVMLTLKDLAVSEKTDVPEFAELKRRLAWEYNGMRLHELYFENLTSDVVEPDPELKIVQKITEQFDTFENWINYFKATAMMRGIGWVTVSYDKVGDRFLTMWINEHDLGHPADTVPLLVLDVFEHAYLTDYGLARADYVEAFMKAIDWNKVNQRYITIN
jgi:superoxide dismutase, Fe-Mn family